MSRYVTIDGKQYDLAPLTMSPDCIDLLETAYDMQIDNAKAAKALPLMYRIMVDCLVRGGGVKDEAEAKALLAGVPIDKDSIEMFLSAMMGDAASAAA